jgi:hypothetical protein
MNYTELKANIQQVCEASFTDDQLALFVRQTEQKIYNTVQLANLRKSQTAAVTPNVAYVDCPDDFLSMYSMAVIKATGEYVYLLNKDVNFIREAYPNPTTVGVPKYYAIFGPRAADEDELRFILGPTPDAAYLVEMNYFYYPESITTSADGTTWLGENFDSALLNGALVEAIRFQKGEQDVVALYEKLFNQSITLLKNLGDGKQRQDAYRSGQPRMKVG